ncbi:ribosomal oxygenase 1-like [Antedon mediterranea]|uniref:ribosomal oxygenase 1-like n=1 Tax=Antedon mediterranea TaxID=105859 RepID=UPI003AF7A456
MKAAQKKVSAFTVFKSRSKENVNDENTSIATDKSITKKTKQTARKLRSSLRLKPHKSSQSARPSCLPDSAVTPAPKKKKKTSSSTSKRVNRGRRFSSPTEHVTRSNKRFSPYKDSTILSEQSSPPKRNTAHSPSPAHSKQRSPSLEHETRSRKHSASSNVGSISSLVHTPTVDPEFKNKLEKKKTKSTGSDEQVPMKKRRRFSADGRSDAETPVRGNSTVTPRRFLSGGELEDSGAEAQKLFEWMIGPVEPDKFFKNLWERKPLLVKRHMPDYNSIWFSTDEFNRILREEDIQFTVNLDVTTYTDGCRETHNPQGRAHAPVVWDYYQNGCSIRLLNPQTFSQPVWKLLSTLQEYFSCGVGANVYLTPPGSQGFAPHFDDIEAFVIQLEGKKHWRLYSPLTEAESLPRFSSTNFNQSDIGEPILDVILEAGDLLYFPRGFIHQADTIEENHSLHMTVSTCQRNTWGDLLEKMMPQILKIAFAQDPEFRKSLPRDYTQYMGVANSDSTDPHRIQFLQTIGRLMSKLTTYAPVDSAADQMAVKYLHDSLPPVINKHEKQLSVFGAGASWRNGRVVDDQDIFSMSTKIKLIRKTCLRLVMEEDAVLVYYNLENSKVYHGKPPQSFEIPAEAAVAVEYLLNTYPEYVPIKSLPTVGDMEDKQIEIAQVLFEKGILLLKDSF